MDCRKAENRVDGQLTRVVKQRNKIPEMPKKCLKLKEMSKCEDWPEWHCIKPFGKADTADSSRPQPAKWSLMQHHSGLAPVPLVLIIMQNRIVFLLSSLFVLCGCNPDKDEKFTEENGLEKRSETFSSEAAPPLVSSLLSGVKSANMEKFSGLLESVKNDEMRRAFSRIISEGDLTSEELRFLADYIFAEIPNSRRAPYLIDLMKSCGQRDVESGLSILGEVGPGHTLNAATTTLINNSSSVQDLVKIARWVENLGLDDLSNQSTGALGHSLGRLPLSSLEKAYQKDFSGIISDSFELGMGLALGKELDDLSDIRMAKQMESSFGFAEGGYFMNTFWQTATSENSDVVLKALKEKEVPKENADQVATILAVKEYRDSSFENAIELLSAVNEDYDVKDSVTVVFDRWLMSNSMDAGEFIAEMPPGNVRNMGIGSLIRYSKRNGELESAQNWSEYLEEQK
jgi:hypothetical protein